MSKGIFVLENKLGQTVRTLDLPTGKITAVRRHDTGRIEFTSSTVRLRKQGVQFDVLSDFTRSKLTKSPVSLGDFGALRFVPEVQEYSASVKLPEETNSRYRSILKWTAFVHVLALALILILAQLLKPEVKPEETRTVKIVPRNEVVPTVSMSDTKVVRKKRATKRKIVSKRKKVAKKKVLRRKKIRRKAKNRKALVSHRSKRRNRKSRVSGLSLNNMGAVGALGTINKKNSRRGGLNLNAVKASAGPGLGGTGGSGGMQSVLYGKGLVNVPLGAGAKASGAGGYGTKGKGGGKAGYGQISLAGASDAYFEPLEEQAIIHGGLDREQVAAVIRRHIGQIVYCYEQGLQVKPGLKGRVAVRFVISNRGKVNTAKVSHTSLRSRKVEGCIVNKLRAWKFPRPVGDVNVKVTYPFVLRRTSRG